MIYSQLDPSSACRALVPEYGIAPSFRLLRSVPERPLIGGYLESNRIHLRAVEGLYTGLYLDGEIVTGPEGRGCTLLGKTSRSLSARLWGLSIVGFMALFLIFIVIDVALVLRNEIPFRIDSLILIVFVIQPWITLTLRSRQAARTEEFLLEWIRMRLRG
jgi:hypothetical protein